MKLSEMKVWELLVLSSIIGLVLVTINLTIMALAIKLMALPLVKAHFPIFLTMIKAAF